MLFFSPSMSAHIRSRVWEWHTCYGIPGVMILSVGLGQWYLKTKLEDNLSCWSFWILHLSFPLQNILAFSGHTE